MEGVWAFDDSPLANHLPAIRPRRDHLLPFPFVGVVVVVVSGLKGVPGVFLLLLNPLSLLRLLMLWLWRPM